MKDHQKALAALETALGELGFPVPANVFTYTGTEGYMTAAAVYQGDTSTLPPVPWAKGGQDGIIPVLHLDRDDVGITIQASRWAGAAA